MGNIAVKTKVDTEGQYKALSDIFGVAIEQDVVYNLQATGPIVLCFSTSLPTEGGNEITGGAIVKFKLTDGDNAYIMTRNIPSKINLSK